MTSRRRHMRRIALALAGATAIGILTGVPAHASTDTRYITARWGGYMAVSSARPVLAANATFTVPPVTCKRAGQGSMWVGIGGAQPKYGGYEGTSGQPWLEQDGVIAICSGAGKAVKYEPFWEVVGNTAPPPHAFNATISANDQVQASVYAPATSGVSHAWVFQLLIITNPKTGASQLVQASDKLTSRDYGMTAEAITEYPTPARSFPLGTIRYTNATYVNKATDDPPSIPITSIVMVMERAGVTITPSAPYQSAEGGPADSFSTYTTG